MEEHQRFIEKVEATPTCWNWTGSLNEKGYGQFGFGGNRSGRAHRYSYTYFKGPIPKGMQIDHLCRNRRCVNPDHLEAVDARSNNLRGIGIAATNARKTHCKRGHLLEVENLHIYTNKRGNRLRICKTCKKMSRKPALTDAAAHIRKQ